MLSKKCNWCLEEKLISEFYKDKNRCKNCYRVKRKICCSFDLGYVYWEYSNSITEQIGSKNANGYLDFRLNGKLTKVHRYIYEQYHNIVLKPNEFIDHIDRNRLNNKIDNLRIVTAQQNMQNITHQKNCSSKFKGVSLHKKYKKWEAYIWYNYKKICLGYFDDEIEAARAYNEKAIEYNEKSNCVYTLNQFE